MLGKIKDKMDMLTQIDKYAREQYAKFDVPNNPEDLKVLSHLHHLSAESRALLKQMAKTYTIVYFDSDFDVAKFFENIRNDRKVVEFGEGISHRGVKAKYIIHVAK